MMEDEEVKLLSCWLSPYGMRAELAFKAKGIGYQYVEENLKNKSKMLLSSNPVYKKVPVLIHNGTPICESRLMTEYIDETWPAKPLLLPIDPYDRYLVRFWSDFLDNKRMEVVSPLFRVKNAEVKRVMMKKAVEEFYQVGITIEGGLAELEQRGLICMEGKGDLKYMDVCFAPYVAWYHVIEKLFGLKLPQGEKCPCLHRWFENLLGNEEVRSTLPEPCKLTENAKMELGLE